MKETILNLFRCARAGAVVRYSAVDSAPIDVHEKVTRTRIARKLAALKRYDFAGDYDSAKRYRRRLYFVPEDTLIGVGAARQLGIHNEHDLFGGVVPYPFVGTKTIGHPLVGSNAYAPEGWRRDIGDQLRDAVLFGFSAFSREDARKAGILVLDRGVARVKPARGIGGRGQTVVSGVAQLAEVVDRLNPSELSRSGVVVEQNFERIVTYSVGQVRVGELVATYYGLQSRTKDNKAADVYGGSELVVTRGDYDALFKLDIAPNVRTIIGKARAYEAAVSAAFPDFIASRRNYDVAEVTDSDGQRHWGVLEQSWRIGGASPAEIAALEAFDRDPALRVVRASSAEIYGTTNVPLGADVHFQGSDDRLGPMTKYTLVEAYDSSK